MASRRAPAAAKPAGKSRPKSSRGKLAPRAPSRGLDASQVAIPLDAPEIAAVAALVREVGGAVLGAYRVPLGARPLLLACALEHAATHALSARFVAHSCQALGAKIDETAAFFDPLIVVRGEDGQ